MFPCCTSCRWLLRLKPCVGQCCETKSKGAAFGWEQQYWLATFANEYRAVNKLAPLQMKSTAMLSVLPVRYCHWKVVLLLPEYLFCSWRVYRVVDSCLTHPVFWVAGFATGTQAALFASAVLKLCSLRLLSPKLRFAPHRQVLKRCTFDGTVVGIMHMCSPAVLHF